MYFWLADYKSNSLPWVSSALLWGPTLAATRRLRSVGSVDLPTYTYQRGSEELGGDSPERVSYEARVGLEHGHPPAAE